MQSDYQEWFFFFKGSLHIIFWALAIVDAILSVRKTQPASYLCGFFAAYTAFCWLMSGEMRCGLKHKLVDRGLAELRQAAAEHHTAAKRNPENFDARAASGRMPILWRGSGWPHPSTMGIVYYPSRVVRDTGRWAYVNNPADNDFGRIYIDCSHTIPRPWDIIAPSSITMHTSIPWSDL